MSKIEVVRKSHSQFVDVPAGQDPWVVASTFMTSEEVVAVAVYTLNPGCLAPQRRTVGGKPAWRPLPESAPRPQREPSMGAEQFFRDE